MIWILNILFVLIAITKGALVLPGNVEKCSVSSPNLDDCMIDKAAKALPACLDGYAPMLIPPLNPFHIDEVVVEATSTLTVKITDVDVYGFERAKFETVSVDTNKMHVSAKLLIDPVEIKSQYEIAGKILFLDISGTGPALITIDGGVYNFGYDYELIQKNGVDYAKLSNAKFTYDVKRLHFKFDNLFNGDKALGDEMNSFVNENWEEFGKDIQPAISKAVTDIVMNIFVSVTDKVPFYELFDA